MLRIPTRYYPDHGPLLPFFGPNWVWKRALFLVDNQKKASKGRDGPDISRAMCMTSVNERLSGRFLED